MGKNVEEMGQIQQRGKGTLVIDSPSLAYGNLCDLSRLYFLQHPG